jgi:choice-of-anchor B domain-containing protein
MRKVSLLLLLAFTTPSLAQTSLNTTLIGNLNYGRFTNDVWGYTDDSGQDYALVGLVDGVSVVKVTSTGLQQVNFVSGTRSSWRDLKTHGQYLYVTNESSGGLDIIDLSGLPTSVRFVGSYNTAFSTAHNLYIADGYAYIAGSNAAGGVDILDLSNPESPVKVGEWTRQRFHDVYVRNDTLFGSAAESGLVVLDVRDKSDPHLIVEISFPDGGFVHNAWTTEDGRYVMTTQETYGLPVKMWDIRDLLNPRIADQYLATPNLLAHNVQIRGDYAYISHYSDGLRIVDISDPEHLVEVGFYDTHPNDQGGYEGNWGAFPFTSSGYVYATDMQFGLFVIEFNGRRGSRIRGRIVDSQTSQPLEGVAVEVVEVGQRTVSDEEGRFKLGAPNPGTYTIQAQSFFYDTTSAIVTLAEGELDSVDLLMSQRPVGDIAGRVVDPLGEGIAEAEIRLLDTPLDSLRTDAAGSFQFSQVPAGTYTAVVGKWGFRTLFPLITVVADQATDEQIILPKQYADNFELDLGWEVSDGSDNFKGPWRIVAPGDLGFALPYLPLEDATSPPGRKAYFARTLASELTLTSPLFDLTGAGDPALRFMMHWYPRGDNNDSLIVDISSNEGRAWTRLAAFGDRDATGGWQEVVLPIPSSVARTSLMRVRFITKEKGFRSSFAAIDEFEVLTSVTGVAEWAGEVPDSYSLEQNYPNPFNAGTTIRYSLPKRIRVRLKVYNVVGKEIRTLVDEVQQAGSHRIVWDGRDESGDLVPSGVYLYRLETSGFFRGYKMLLLR